MAIGHGRPVVVADVGSLGDTARARGRSRRAAGDPAALAEACVRMLRHHPVPSTAARDALSWDRAAEAHEAVYRELVAERA